MSINEKQRRFAEEYVVDLNATQAATRAGYSEKTAYSQGQRLLKHVEVAALIERLMEKKRQRIDLTADRVLEEEARIAFLDPADLFDDMGRLHTIQDMPEQARRAIKSLEVVEINEDGTGRIKGYVSKVKFEPKGQALGRLERHLGMYERDNAQRSDHERWVRLLAAQGADAGGGGEAGDDEQ